MWMSQNISLERQYSRRGIWCANLLYGQFMKSRILYNPFCLVCVPVNTGQYILGVNSTSFERYGPQMDVKTTNCAYWLMVNLWNPEILCKPFCFISCLVLESVIELWNKRIVYRQYFKRLVLHGAERDLLFKKVKKDGGVVENP